ncbi:MAG: monovalent cation/H(+) antiporter subunit G [Bryobacterales bacterium]|nr:monovalent cation/H(+) antiporter subunit G [Bryobacterales bacterium]
MTIADMISMALLSFGTLLMLVAAFGVVRMPDVYLRLSVASKASTLGLVFLVVAVPLSLNDLGTLSRVAAVVLFVFLTAPVAAHMIGRAAYVAGVPVWKETIHDDLKGKYHPDTRALASQTESHGSDQESSMHPPESSNASQGAG